MNQTAEFFLYSRAPGSLNPNFYISKALFFLKISPTIFHTFAGSDFSTSFLTLRSK